MELVWKGKPSFDQIEDEIKNSGSYKIEENSFVYGDNFYTMSLMLKDWEGKIDLIYMDPPFATGKNFLLTDKRKGYTDRWKSLEDYLEFMYKRLYLCKKLLKKTGSIYIHIDYRTDGYIRVLGDEIFGYKNLRNIIYWHYGLGGSSPKKWQQKTDTILFYTKSDNWYFKPLMVPATSNKMKGQKKKMDNVWDIPAINNMAKERTGYPTQKPEELLRRIILSSSKEDDIVFDPFAGSGTTLFVAKNLGRRFIGIDNSLQSWDTIKKRVNCNTVLLKKEAVYGD